MLGTLEMTDLLSIGILNSQAGFVDTFLKHVLHCVPSQAKLANKAGSKTISATADILKQEFAK